MACDIFSIACVCMLGAFVAFICVRRPNLIFFTLHYITFGDMGQVGPRNRLLEGSRSPLR